MNPVGADFHAFVALAALCVFHGGYRLDMSTG
jgi:hypothetical protein